MSCHNYTGAQWQREAAFFQPQLSPCSLAPLPSLPLSFSRHTLNISICCECVSQEYITARRIKMNGLPFTISLGVSCGKSMCCLRVIGASDGITVSVRLWRGIYVRRIVASGLSTNPLIWAFREMESVISVCSLRLPLALHISPYFDSADKSVDVSCGPKLLNAPKTKIRPYWDGAS